MNEAKPILVGCRQPVKLTTLQRFECKWIPEPFSGCHIWTAAVCGNGYGTFKAGGKKGRTAAAHRLAWEISNGPIPVGLCVLHKCDTPACINPAHLFLGTKQDNSDDAVRKGRTKLLNTFRGEDSAMARLTNALVIEVLTSQESRSVIAKRLGVGASNVKKIRARRIWSHIALTDKQEALRLKRSRRFS